MSWISSMLTLFEQIRRSRAAFATRRAAILALCIAAFVCASLPSHAGETLRIATSGDYPPFSERVFGGTSGPYRGFDIEVAKAFAADRGYRIEWVQFKWPRLANELERGRFDIAMSGVTVRPDRSALGRFSVPVVATGAVLLFQRKHENSEQAGLPLDQRLQRLDHPDMRIAVNAGGHLERVARKLLVYAKVMAIPNNASVRQALISGMCDAVVTDSIEAPVWLKNTTGLVALGPLTQDRKAYLARPDRPALSQALDSWLLARETDGSLAKWRRRYFGKEEWERTAEPMTALLASVDERLALMPLVAEEKRGSPRPVEDTAQEQRVLNEAVARVNAIAMRDELSPLHPDKIRAFYQAQIEAAKAIQRDVLSRHSAAEEATRKYDLSGSLRPALARISGRIAELLVRISAQPLPDDLSERVRREIHATGLPARHLREIQIAIAEISHEESP